MKNQTEEVKESMETHLEYYKMDSNLPLHSNNRDNISALKIPSSHKERSLDYDDLDALLHVYKVMFPSADMNLSMLSRIINMEYRSRRTAGILGSWPEIDGNINQTTLNMTFGTVDFYFSHSVLKEGEYKKYFFACVTWYMTSNDTIYNNLNPLLVVLNKLYSLPGGPLRFLLVQRISSHCSFATVKNSDKEERYISCPFWKPFL
jgi:hypothetical protein